MEMCDSADQALPVRELLVFECLAGRGEAVVLARRSVLRLLPGGVDQAIALQPTEQRVEGAFRGGEGLPLAEGYGELVAVMRLLADEGEDTQLEHSSPSLS